MERAKPPQSYFRPDEASQHPESSIRKVHDEFSQRIDAADYPCVVAKSAAHTSQYRLGNYGKVAEPPIRCVWQQKIGRASCRERVCQDGEIEVVAVSLKKKKKQMK